MGKVLVEKSKVTCGGVPPDEVPPNPPNEVSPHQGAVSMAGAARLVVDGSRVLTTESVKEATISKTCTNPGNLGGPCTAINVLTFLAGTSTRLRVDGVFVVLDSLQAKTDKASPVHVVQPSINNDRLEAD